MNLEERIILWLVQHEAASEERDLLNDALEELEQAREQLKTFADGVNRRCGCDINQLPLVSLEHLTARLAAAEARIEELCVEREAYREAGVNMSHLLKYSGVSRTVCREDIDIEASRILESRGETWGEKISEAAKGGRDATA